MKPVTPARRESTDWFEVFFVRLRDGFRDHLRHFSTKPVALIVYVWALLNRDHETGEFVADRVAIMNSTGLTERQVKDALRWLRHGRRCLCDKCRDLPQNVTTRPAYLEEIRPAFRSAPPILRIRRDDSEFLAAAKRARKKKGADQTEFDFGDNSGDNGGAIPKGVAKGVVKGSSGTTPFPAKSLVGLQSVVQDLRSQIEDRRRGAP